MKRIDARRLLLVKHLRSSGPVTLEEVSARFGWTTRESEKLLRLLVREGTVAEGEFVPDRPSPQFCWQANLEALHRETLKRLKSEIEPLSLAEYCDFLLRWQHVHPGTRLQGKQGLLEVIRQLEGYGTFPLLWQRDILPSRVVDFDRRWLAELLEEGTLTFGRFCLIGQANYTPGGGTVFCGPRSLAYLFVENEPPNYTWSHRDPLRPCCLDAYGCVTRSGSASLDEITQSTKWRQEQVEVALWKLYDGGILTNTSVRCLIDCTCTSFLPGRPRGRREEPDDEEKERQRLRRYGLRADLGRWISCASLRDSASTRRLGEDVRLRQRVHHALRMYGIAPVPVLVRHFEALFAQSARTSPTGVNRERIRQACEELVGAGKAIKGLFVSGLDGSQYALPGVPEQARETLNTGPERTVMISSLDPASLYISFIPGPAVNAYRFPGRFMVLAGGRLAAVIDQKSGAKRRFVVSNVHLAERMEPEDVCRLIDALADFARRSGHFDVLDVRSIENGPAARHPLAAIFLHRGFQVSGTRLWIPLKAVRPWKSGSLPRIRKTDASGQGVDPIARLRAALESVLGDAITRQRNQGRTVLKHKGRVLVNCPDGKEPVLLSVSIREDQRDLFAAIPKAFKRHARKYQFFRSSHVEVRLPPGTDFDGAAFRRLARVWFDHLRRRLQRAARKRAKGKQG